tara:strand:- start:175 stop:1071 length:897 start_codon:yes stop_codon:yes gene_type:complete
VTSLQAVPILLSLASALMFAVTFVLVKITGQNVSSLAALCVTLTTNVVTLWGWSLLSAQESISISIEWGYFAIAGIFAPLMGRFFQFQGMAKLGANITTPLTLTHPVVTVLFAVIFLGETLRIEIIVGVLMVLFGSLLLGAQNGNHPKNVSEVSKKYLLFPLAASFTYGVSVVFRKAGIDIGTDAVTAAAVTTTSSWLVLSIYLVAFRPAHALILCHTEFVTLVIAGIFSSIGPVLLYMALQKGHIAIIAPLAATTPFFVLLITFLFMRDNETFSVWIIIGTLFTVLGSSFMAYIGMS